MRTTVLLLICCFIGLGGGACAKKESSEETAAQKESTEATEIAKTPEAAAIVGTWRIKEWKADHVDQIEMWRIGDLTVQFRADGSIQSKLVYSNGDERVSGGTWKIKEDKIEIIISGGGETEGDEPFERTREFTIDQLTPEAFAVHAEVGPSEKPIRLTYLAHRVAASGD